MPRFQFIRDQLAAAIQRGERTGPLDLRNLNRIIRHTPEDMTVTVEAGVTLAELQRQIARFEQWLPLDPPVAEAATIADLVLNDLSGPRRFGFGTVRDHLLGISVICANGELIRAGGQVVKNVAGYDLCKLFVGSHGTLGVLVEATFKLQPVPEIERFVQLRCASLDLAGKLMTAVLESNLTPTAFDLVRDQDKSLRVVLGFAGVREDVESQMTEAERLGFLEASTLDHDQSFRCGDSPVHHTSVLPARLIDTVRNLGDLPFVARAGNGILYSRAEQSGNSTPLPAVLALMRRVKDTLDPTHVFPELRL